MKKIYILILSCAFTLPGIAQQADVSTSFSGFPTVDDAEYLKLVQQKRQNYFKDNKIDIVSERISHTDERVINSGLTFGGLFQIPFLQDSIAKEKFNNTDLRGVSTHSIGAIFDPTSDDFVLINKAVHPRDNFTVETIHIGGRYNIVNPAVIDTLRIVAFPADTGHDGSNAALFPVNFAGQPAFGLRQTASTAHGYHDGIDAPGKIVIDHIFSQADTSTNVQYLDIPIPGGMNIPSGQIFAFNAYFIPGAPYTGVDNYRIVDDASGIPETMNSFQGFARQEDAPSPTLFAIDPSSWGMTHSLSSESRYGTHAAPNEFRNERVGARPSAALLIDFTYSASPTTVGIREKSNASGAVLGHNYPNPFKGVTKINYSLNRASQVSFEITDITGKRVMVINQGQQTAGSYILELNVADLNTGIYYYTIITDSGNETKKMIVLE